MRNPIICPLVFIAAVLTISVASAKQYNGKYKPNTCIVRK